MAAEATAEGAREERSAIFETRLAAAAERKASGNEHFKAARWQEALECYERGLWQAEFDEMQYNFELLDPHRAQVDQARAPLLLNAAASLLKLGRPQEAADRCSEALDKDPDNAKALFRRGQALRQAGRLEKALADLTRAAKLEPSDALVRRALREAQEEARAEQRESRALWQGKLAEASAASPPPESDEATPAPGPCSRFCAWLGAALLGRVAEPKADKAD